MSLKCIKSIFEGYCDHFYHHLVSVLLVGAMETGSRVGSSFAVGQYVEILCFFSLRSQLPSST